jgi:hypothetical protein
MSLQKNRKKTPVTKPNSSVTAVASFYSTLFLQLPEFGFKGVISVCAPVFGYLTFIVWKVVHSRVRLAYYEYETKKYITELESEKIKPGLCGEEIREIESRIKNYRDAMHERRVNALEGI